MRSLRIIVIGTVLTIVWYSCVEHDFSNEDVDGDHINLRWVRGHAQETKEDLITGLAWNLSFLGANLPPASLESAIHWRNDRMFSLSLGSLGFSTQALQALKVLSEELKKTQEYRLKGGLDVGRFIMLTLNSSYHYYAITQAELTLAAFRSKYDFGNIKGAIINSSIAKGHRLASIAQSNDVAQIAFLVAEGEGSIAEGTFQEIEFETLDIMPNGQLRFALYDKNGNLKSAASPELTDAGKPAKCLWCHEIKIQPLNVMESVAGYYTYEEFKNIIQDQQHVLDQFRTTLTSVIDFTKRQDHTLGELLYISFMEPSHFRLAEEWSIPEREVESLLNGLSTHKHPEFPFLGEKLFDRKDVDDLAPYDVARVPENAREHSVYEPEIIRP